MIEWIIFHIYKTLLISTLNILYKKEGKSKEINQLNFQGENVNEV